MVRKRSPRFVLNQLSTTNNVDLPRNLKKKSLGLRESTTVNEIESRRADWTLQIISTQLLSK